MTQSTPPLGQVLSEFTNKKISEIHTAYPAEVVSYDNAKFQASVSLQIKKLINGVETDIPVLNNVPVLFPRAGDAHFIFPVEKGTHGLCIFQERSIDGWQELGRPLLPEDKRIHDLNDGIFIPGLSPKTNLPRRKGAIDSLEVAMGNSFLEFQKSGTIKINNEATFIEINSAGKVKIQGAGGELIEQLSQLISLIDEILTTLSTTTVPTVPNPVTPLSTVAQWPILKTMLLQISTKIDSLKA